MFSSVSSAPSTAAWKSARLLLSYWCPPSLKTMSMTNAESGTSISAFCHQEPFTALMGLPLTLNLPFTSFMTVASGSSQLLHPELRVMAPYCFTPARHVAAAL